MKVCTNVKSCLLIKYFIIIISCKTFDGYMVENKNFYRSGLQTDISNWFINYSLQPENIICCANGQWEAGAFLTYGSVLAIPETNSFFYYNGTGRIVFDDVRKKSYVSFNITAFSPQVPVYSNFTATTITDFNTGEMYQIDDDGNCVKQTILMDLQVVCIPERSRRLAKGEVGTETVSTYQFSTSNRVREWVVTASVLQNGTHCVPASVSLVEYVTKGAPQGTVCSLDILDIVHGIEDPRIFILPKSCKQ